MTPDHIAFQVRSSGYGRFPEKALTQDATGRLRFVVMQPVGYTPWCSTDERCGECHIISRTRIY